jgi:hypothetical protein
MEENHDLARAVHTDGPQNAILKTASVQVGKSIKEELPD